MTNEYTVEFRGGPIDGTVRSIPELMVWFVLPVSSHADYWREGTEPGESEVTFTTVRYELARDLVTGIPKLNAVNGYYIYEFVA